MNKTNKADIKKIVNKNVIKFSDLFDRPIAFHRAFVRLTKSVTAGLLLSQAVYWSKRTNNEEGWFWKTQEEWFEETGLTRREQESSRDILRGLGILEEKRAGMPAKIFYRINQEVLWNSIKDFNKMNHECEVIDSNGIEKSEQNPQYVQNVQSSMYKSDKLVPTEKIPPLASPLSKITNNSARTRTENVDLPQIEPEQSKQNDHLGCIEAPNGHFNSSPNSIGFKTTRIEYDSGMIGAQEDLGGLKSNNNETMEWVEKELERITGTKFDLKRKK